MACRSCSRLASIRAGPSSIPKRAFSATSFASARPAIHPSLDLTYPTKPNPDPFEIFHFSRDERLDAKVIKSRYLDLVRKYHPDRMQQSTASSSSSKSRGKGKGKAKEESVEFKQIVKAYELLSDPKKRASYVNYGIGWGSGGRGTAGGGSASANPWSQSTTEYHFRRGRPMSSTASGDRWSGTWDYTWTDPHNPHFRPEHAAAAGVGNPSGSGWEGRGTIGKNGFIFLGLASITLFISPLTAWYSFPSIVSPEEMAAANDGSGTAWIPRMYDKRHLDAARNLQLAREEARQGGQAKLEAFRRRAKQIEREKAYERALKVQAIERSGGTGHLALPPPSD
ncbi:Jid1p [Sporobolomyces koalae]|uniref:Jid1p n=1 Tax=Sporobolomyces koalae TaxID=500713 RepID=UPI00317E090B